MLKKAITVATAETMDQTEVEDDSDAKKWRPSKLTELRGASHPINPDSRLDIPMGAKVTVNSCPNFATYSGACRRNVLNVRPPGH
jgi:hypothetical protein